MSEQTAQQVGDTERSRVPAFVRRVAGSRAFTTRPDATMIKQGLGGIKDWTSRLPGVLDRPPWRAPLPNVTELSPGWRRHDRTHLEINLEYPAAADAWTWEAWFFLPQSFRLDSDSYTKRQIGADIQSHVRLSAPELDLRDVSREAKRVAGVIRRSDPSRANDELKLFACRVRETIARATLQVRLLDDTEEMEVAADELAAATGAAMADLRQRLGAAIEDVETVDPSVAEVVGWIDEHLSNVLEVAMVKLVRDLSRRQSTSPALERVKQAAIAEARHRADAGAGSSVSADSSTFDLEQVERHRHALKRVTSSVLWLESEASDPRRSPEHALHSIAAGIAMAFAVAAALLYGTPNDATDLWVWGGLAVLAYMGKDRIKAALQDVFNGYIDKRYPNRKWVVRHGATGSQVAAAEEKFRFVEPDELPSDVAQFRHDLQRDSLGETLELDSILHHRQTMKVDAQIVKRVDRRFDALTEILRVDVARWLTHTDDPSRSVMLADPESGELFKSSLPRAYDVTILHRLAPPGADADWSAARVVLSRKGIRRVDQLEA